MTREFRGCYAHLVHLIEQPVPDGADRLATGPAPRDRVAYADCTVEPHLDPMISAMASDPVPEPSFEAAREPAAILRADLMRHERLYYVEGSPDITDAEFDRWIRQLQGLERQYPSLVVFH